MRWTLRKDLNLDLDVRSVVSLPLDDGEVLLATPRGFEPLRTHGQ
jgi:hypothetical protein